MPYFSFLRRHRKFFETHFLASSEIPIPFLLRLGDLGECSVISSVALVFQRLKKLSSSANSSLKLMVPQAWPEEGEIMINRASHGVQVQAVVGRNTIMPKSVVETIGVTMEKLVKGGFVDIKMVDKVGVGIYLCDDKQAGIMFPRADGEVDMTTLFVSEASRFCGWCSDLFNHYWQRGKKFDVNKTRVME